MPHPHDQDDDRPRGDVPPHDLEAERGLLSGALSGTHGAIDAITHVPPDAFYRPAHGHIAAAIHTVTAAGHSPDPIAVADQLRRDQLLDTAGGPSALVELLATRAANPELLARIVLEHAERRTVLGLATELADIARHADPGAAVLTARDLLDTHARTHQRVTNLEIPDLATIVAGDLTPETPEILTRTDGLALLYPGRVHSFAAEPESGKSWIALAACAEVLTIGGAALYIDWEDTPTGVVGRLLALGADPTDIIERFRYIQPVGPWGPAEAAQTAELCDQLVPDVVILDGIAEALTRDGLDENAAPDWVNWAEKVARPLARAGAAVLALDHVVKARDDRGRHARGTGAKLASIDGAAYELVVRAPFSRRTAGSVSIRVSKDRPGAVRQDHGREVAVATIEPHDNGERVTLTIVPPSEAGDATFRPTSAMETISRALEHGDPVDPAAVRRLIPGAKKETVSNALRFLLADGYLVEVAHGPKRFVRSARPYRGDDPTDDTPPPDNVRKGPWQPHANLDF